MNGHTIENSIPARTLDTLARPFAARTSAFVLLTAAGLVAFVLELTIGAVRIPVADVIRILAGQPVEHPTWAQIVLSGEKAVSEVVAELSLSRGTYYKLETKALAAMLRALAPGADGADSPEAATTTQRIAELEAKVARLEQEKRRGERLLYLARKLVPPGPVTTGAGRPPAWRSTNAGRGPSPSSPTTARTSAPAPSASTPRPAGATTP
jgi:hypothetical protein